MNRMIMCLLMLFPSVLFADICSPDPAPRFSKYSKPTDDKPVSSLFIDSTKTRGITFKTNAEPGPYGSYITLALDYPKYEKVFNQLKKDYPLLKNRGEAHITALTPVEYNCHFKPAGTTIKQLESVIEEFIKSNSYKMDFSIQRLGSHQVDQKETFFIIVESQDLLKLRQKWATLPQKGFKAENFYPHITLGYTDQDLHSSQGVIKDELHSRDYRYNLQTTQ